MRKIFENQSELDAELGEIEKQELDFNFTRKQKLAHLLFKVMKTSKFEEAKLIGQIEGEYTDEGMHPGIYFDAKTKTQDYTGVDINDPYSYDGGREARDAMAQYEQRTHYLNQFNQSDFSKLTNLSSVMEDFCSQHKNLETELFAQMTDVGFNRDYKSIVKAVMSKSDYEEWLILSEQKMLSHEVRDQNLPKTKTRQKKI